MVRRFSAWALLLMVLTAGVAYGQDDGGGDGDGDVIINPPAGVEVDAAGVLRTHMVRDPAGRLTRERMLAAKAALPADLMGPSKLRKISLNRLEEALSARLARGEAPTDEMLNLAGLTRLQHVFYFPESRDIVIAGPAEGFMIDLGGRPIGLVTGKSVLELQDLATALRAFGPTGERARVIGCSIDPTPEGLANLQAFLRKVGGTIHPGEAEQFALGVRDSLGLQNVSVKGVPPTTHYAQVLVEADYRMKLIGIGLEKPPVKITTWISQVNPATVAKNALQRWYFTPDYECVRVSEDELAMELVGSGVKLISENEMVRADGGREAAAVISKASETFVKSFTEHYPDLAARNPVYAQMRNLIDMAIAAAYIQHQDYYGASGWDLGVLGREESFPVQTLAAPKHVEPAINALWKRNRLMTPIGGGVHVEPLQALQDENLLEDENGALDAARKAVSVEGLEKGQWWWD